MAVRVLRAPAKRAVLRALALLEETSLFYTARVDMACSRGALNVATRRFDPRRTRTWEFSAFSQNGEDGVIDHLLSTVTESNRYFVEVGSADGLENNSSFLAFVKKYNGIMVEGDPYVANKAWRMLSSMNLGVRHLNVFMTTASVASVLDHCLHRDPDFFSLDIDGNDLHIVRCCLDGGLRPKVVCVEYNSAFGPDRPITVPYSEDIGDAAGEPRLHYGASIAAWRHLLEPRGYRFVTVESRGINAFFVDRAAVDETALDGVEGLDFAENVGQFKRFGGGWEVQFRHIEHLPFVTVGEEAG